MINDLSLFISVTFILTVLLTFYFFHKAHHANRTVSIALFTWIILQSIISYSEFYTNTNSLPPRFLLLPLPALLTILILFSTAKGRGFLHSLDDKWLTYVHIVRIPVELVLYWLFLEQAVPQLMTFTGRNFDILAGLTAPLVAYLFYNKKTLGKAALLIWNIISLILLINIVGHAILSLPFPFQQLAFEQPNIAVLYFPFSLLPGFIVPVVLLSHLTVIVKLVRKLQ